MLQQGGDDLPRFDPEAPDLDLMVDAAQVLDVTVRPEPGEVTGAVQPCAGGAGEGVGDEALSSQIRPAQVSTGQPGATDTDLGRHAHGDRLSRWIEQVDAPL